MFSKVCPDLPFEIKGCFNGHAWATQPLRQAGSAFAPRDHGCAWCADPPRRQERCSRLTAATVHALVDQLPWPLSTAERAAGYRPALSIWQREGSRTQVFGDAEPGRALGERLIRDNLARGRPDRVRRLFDRQLTSRTPGAFATEVIQDGVLPSLRGTTSTAPASRT